MTPIFVIGSPRSGGTLLYNILCSDRRCNPALTENHFIAHLAMLYAASKHRLELEEGHYFSDEADLKGYYRKLAADFLDKIFNHHIDCTQLVLKSILLSNHSPALNELLPEVRFIASVRDPRDIVASMIEVGIRQKRLGEEIKYPRDVHRLATMVMNSYMPLLGYRSASIENKVLWVKYEDLVKQPRDVILEIESWSGLDLTAYDPNADWPRDETATSEKKRDGAPFITESWGNAISDSSVARYQQQLDGGEIKQIESICQPLMSIFAYPVSRVA